MSEELSNVEIPEDEMVFWRGEVDKYVEKRRAEGVERGRALEFIDPEKCAKILYYLKEGWTDSKISKHLGIQRRTITGMACHHAEPLAVWQPKLAAKLTRITFGLAQALSLKVEQIIDDPEELRKVGIEKLAIAYGVVNDKTLHHHGQAAMKIEHVKASAMEEYAALQAEAKKRLEDKKAGAIEAEVIPYGAEVAEA